MKNCTMFATITANGFIADSNGNEDIFSDANWNLFVDLANKHKNIIWGRKTYEMVESWGEDYIDCFNSIKIFVISNSNIKPNRNNVVVCKDMNELQQELKKNDIEIPFVSGGTSIYTLFFKENLINKIIFSYNSIFLSKGTNLFNQEFEIKKYKITKYSPINNIIICIEMEK